MLIILFVLLAGLAIAGLVALVISLAGRTDPRSRRGHADPGWTAGTAGTYGVYDGNSGPPHEHGPGCGGGSSNSGCGGGSGSGCGGGSSSGCGGGSSSSCGGGSSSSCGGGS